ncbi:Molecular chaperone EcpD [Bordetella sputigena]|uniref:fimbria/pilus periplasmic chaperone n=1 Tax=Bordetella sputigena TaxID=1416810 RepID=UPI0039F066FB
MRGLSRVLWAALLGSVTAYVHAGVSLSGTRVIYPEQSRQVGVRLSNDGSRPTLVQAWIDTGDANAKPEALSVPFVVMPPVFRVEAGKAQVIRLSYTKEALPPDRESVFWLNVLEIPPKADANAGSQNWLQIAYRTRVKLFFRPRDLKGDPATAAGKVKWSVLKTDRGSALRAENPTQFAVSYSTVDVLAPGRTLQAMPGMVLPFDVATFPLSGDIGSIPRPLKIEYSTINDYGALVPGETSLP